MRTGRNLLFLMMFACLLALCGCSKTNHYIAVVLFKNSFVFIGFAFTTAAILGGLAAAGAIGGAAIQAHAAGSAADKQTKAAQDAAAVQEQAAAEIRQQAIDAGTAAAQKVADATTQANATLGAGTDAANQVIQSTLNQQMFQLQPYITAGQISLGDLQTIFAQNGPLTGPGSQFKFTEQDYAHSPEFAFETQQANQALQRSAAAGGTLMGGGTVKASGILNTGLASTYLDSAFNRALATYNTNRQNLLTRIQGLTNITGLGFNATGAANQDIGNAGLQAQSNIYNTGRQTAANTIASGQYGGNTGLWAAQIGAQALAGAANATSAADVASGQAQAAGTIASGNAWNGAIGGAINSLSLPLTYGLLTAPTMGYISPASTVTPGAGLGSPAPLTAPTVNDITTAATPITPP